VDAAWAAKAVQRITAALRSSNAKVQWNACHAASQALQRSINLRGDAEAATQLAPLHDGVLEVLAGSVNFKSRTQAAAALEGLSAESATPEQRHRMVSVLSHAVEAVCGRTQTVQADTEADVRTANVGGQHAVHRATVFSAAQQSDVAISELRYRPGLLAQLQKTLQHLQALDLV